MSLRAIPRRSPCRTFWMPLAITEFSFWTRWMRNSSSLSSKSSVTPLPQRRHPSLVCLSSWRSSSAAHSMDTPCHCPSGHALHFGHPRLSFSLSLLLLKSSALFIRSPLSSCLRHQDFCLFFKLLCIELFIFTWFFFFCIFGRLRVQYSSWTAWTV